MDRITVNLTPALGKKLRAKAKAERRPVSDYVEGIIERHMEEIGLLPIDGELARTLTEVRQLGGKPEQILRAAIPALTANSQTLSPEKR